MTSAAAHRFNFISGLPRSGSTLLSAILNQNPRFHCGVSSPMAALVISALNQVSIGSEFGAQVSTQQRKSLLRGLFDSYYADAPAEVVFDTNRIWSGKLPLLLDLFPAAKIIACVRNVAWVLDSLERLYRNNMYENTGLFASDAERSTIYSRMEALTDRGRLVGLAWSALRDAFYSEQAVSMLLVDYNLLAQRPSQTVDLIYRFLDEPAFAHDFEHLEFDRPDYDAALGIKGMHRVRPKVELEARTTILPPDLFDQYSKLSFWQDTSTTQARVIVARAEPQHD
jgi:sulfotransferase